MLHTDCTRDSSTKRCRFEQSLYVAFYIKVHQNPYNSSGDETEYRHEGGTQSLHYGLILWTCTRIHNASQTVYGVIYDSDYGMGWTIREL
jgi:hypothetical protein